MFDAETTQNVQHSALDLHVSSSAFAPCCGNVARMTHDAYSTETRGQRLRRLREAAGLTLKQLAEVLDSEWESRITHYEKDRREMSISDAVKLSLVLNTSAAHLLCLDNDQPVLSDREQKLIQSLRALDAGMQEEFHQRIAALALIHAPVAGELVSEVIARSKNISRAVVGPSKGEERRVEPRTKSKARSPGRH